MLQRSLAILSPPNKPCTGQVGLPSAHALGLGDPVKLDERCSLEAHSPDLRHFRAFLRPPTRKYPAKSTRGRPQAVGRLFAKHEGLL